MVCRSITVVAPSVLPGNLVWALLLREIFSNPLFLPVSLFTHLSLKKGWSLRPLLGIKFCISEGGNWIVGRLGIQTRSPQATLAFYCTGLLCRPLSNNYGFMLFEGLYLNCSAQRMPALPLSYHQLLWNDSVKFLHPVSINVRMEVKPLVFFSSFIEV